MILPEKYLTTEYEASYHYEENRYAEHGCKYEKDAHLYPTSRLFFYVGGDTVSTHIEF